MRLIAHWHGLNAWYFILILTLSELLAQTDIAMGDIVYWGRVLNLIWYFHKTSALYLLFTYIIANDANLARAYLEQPIINMSYIQY